MRDRADSIWSAQHAHPFVRGVGDGTLDEQVFRRYVVQDYLYLIEYGRFFGLACGRARSLDDSTMFARLAHNILCVEMNLHRSFASEWGVSAAELERAEMTPTTRAYTDFLLRTASLGDFGELVGALLPCMWGYQEIAERLANAGLPADDRYARWISEYTSGEYGESVDWCRDLANTTAERIDDFGRTRMLNAFLESSRHELAFWDANWRGE
ncbi:MAG: thiaminase II [Thermoleophilia bacterium]|nr:thiaminase II [Thermoleophilia bacterium]